MRAPISAAQAVFPCSETRRALLLGTLHKKIIYIKVLAVLLRAVKAYAGKQVRRIQLSPNLRADTVGYECACRIVRAKLFFRYVAIFRAAV